MTAPQVVGFFDEATSTVSYIVVDPRSAACAIIDPVLDYEARSGHLSCASLDRLTDYVAAHDLRVEWILETHIHADHLSGAATLQDRIGGRIAVGALVGEVQETFVEYYNLGADFACDGSQFDHLFADDDTFSIGELTARVMHIPGHTPACAAYVIGDAVFVGDALLMPDFGTARCDFPGGDSSQLYRSVRRLLTLPGESRIFVGHDYAPGGRPVAWETTVAEQRSRNVHIRDGVSEEMFVDLRTKRDATLPLPALMLPAVQVNIRAGRMPAPESNGVSYLKIPLTR